MRLCSGHPERPGVAPELAASDDLQRPRHAQEKTGSKGYGGTREYFLTGSHGVCAGLFDTIPSVAYNAACCSGLDGALGK
jgi:hypothetical protein